MIAIILAGGHSERFGRPKAFAEIQGKPFYLKLIETLNETALFDEIVISTNEDLYDQFNYKHVVVDVDDCKDKGPLAGIYSVMCTYQTDLYFVVSVDTPMVTTGAIAYLFEQYKDYQIATSADMVGYQEQQHCIPTLAFYSDSVKTQLQHVLESNDLSMRHLYNQVRSYWVDVSNVPVPSYWYMNINYPKDLERLNEILNV
ncbi:molybdenum cofactor guanylyltransferase MobA [Staphylococcus sp. SQ8-PEA]|uniref:Probable molybdenum cofactor guanylyltransferase n=1 Tax=Staphylococcus marylandisciuri TaxID=2981529 RepID=A0ABT2QMH6_9STAP|nr:molybdenum cofactor guanylyltransferase MobA [Staphylococcus marylandisciuri]MCU5745176.1 molybdenum cofactor guanylyltransferase MobA [Staphylococcus marylandisciuri]